MKLSMNWLSRFVAPPCSAREYAAAMTMSGSKVESVQRMDESIENVLVGKVISVETHPNADRLFIARVDTGRGEPTQVVTAAVNVVPGAWVPVAMHGSVLPGGKTIKAGKLRGVLSDGMLCSIAELDLTAHDEPTADPDGILLIDPEGRAMTPGEPIQDALELSDTRVEFEITNNRPDCLSVRGLARESAAVFGLPLRLPCPPPAPESAPGALVTIEAPDLCERYTARLVRDVKVAPSPRWLRRLLRTAGQRPISNIVDVTNFVMLEYGQPLHAFDYPLLSGGRVVVRRAKAGEALRTLDGQTRLLTEDMLVIADDTSPVAVAGVMGGEGSEITEATKTILLEAACFRGSSVRSTALALNMRTDASSRFEKGLDARMTSEADARACELIALLGAGEPDARETDVWPVRREKVSVAFDCAAINARLGTDIPDADMARCLTAIGCEVQGGEAAIPSHRSDLRIWEDLSEEVARLYGYENIPSALPAPRVSGAITPLQASRARAGALLRAAGYSEMLTYSFAGHGDLDALAMPPDHPLRRALRISNPMGEETSLMRTTALPSLLRSLRRNRDLRNERALLYELAVTYHPRDDALPAERETAVFGGYGKDYDFYCLKGHTEALLSAFNAQDARFEPQSAHYAFHPGRCADVYAGERHIGTLGQLRREVAEGVCACELSFEGLLAASRPEPRFRATPRYPALLRDLALVADDAALCADVERVIAQNGGQILESCVFFDVYKGAGIPEGKKSLAFSLMFRAENRTLTDADADAAVAAILAALDKELGIVLRA
ncbi:MAG: phenylalanine--tRNA ligase subunit beta [Oscillospiraceae bacterium]|jgi:phenylalanyl-tRNA synthetase beta chain|nr:phenylalanine--tRNA ligase subunit beta [Oscillospiraceae bacterium]